MPCSSSSTQSRMQWLSSTDWSKSNFISACLNSPQARLIPDHQSWQSRGKLGEGGTAASRSLDGTLRFLFKNKGSQFHGRGFKMLATLMQHYPPDTVSNAFTSLLLLFNDVQGESESILEYWSQFNGLTLELARCKVMIPSILSVMLFLHALHGYSIIVDQFWSLIKPI
jgi:hypothetical protein